MIGKKRLYRSRAYYWRKCKRVSGTNIVSVPDELLLEILVRLPADDLHHRARVVCRRWRHLIHSDNFIKTQLHRSTYGLFLSFSDHPYSFVTAKQGRIETYHEVSSKVPTGSWLRSSCNGLVLRQCRDTTVSVTNPATGQQFIPPAFPFADMMIFRGCGIGYAADSMEYKVVQPYIVGYHVFLAILSVGSGKPWRYVGVEHLSIDARHHLLHPPLVSEGFITWTRDDEFSYLTLDVETEILTFHPNPLPEACCLVGTYSVDYLSTGRSLSLVVGRRCPKYLMEVWEMMAESGEWRKVVGDINLGAHERWLQQFVRPDYGYPFPLGWVRYPDILALYYMVGSSCILFNLNTQQISSMEMSGELYHKFAHPHKKTLTWFT